VVCSFGGFLMIDYVYVGRRYGVSLETYVRLLEEVLEE